MMMNSRMSKSAAPIGVGGRVAHPDWGMGRVIGLLRGGRVLRIEFDEMPGAPWDIPREELEILDTPETEPNRLLTAINLDLRATSEGNFIVDNNLARLEARGAFDVRGTLAEPVILGRGEVLDGNFFWGENSYSVLQGTVEFGNSDFQQDLLDPWYLNQVDDLGWLDCNTSVRFFPGFATGLGQADGFFSFLFPFFPLLGFFSGRGPSAARRWGSIGI